MCDYRRGFQLDIEFIDLFKTIRNYLNYSAIINFHALQFTRPHSLVFSVCY
jgi:hypothetical protein